MDEGVAMAIGMVIGIVIGYLTAIIWKRVN